MSSRDVTLGLDASPWDQEFDPKDCIVVSLVPISYSKPMYILEF